MLGVPRDAAVGDKEFDVTFHVYLGRLDNHFLRVKIVDSRCIAARLLVHAFQVATIQDMPFKSKWLKGLSTAHTLHLRRLIVDFLELAKDVI